MTDPIRSRFRPTDRRLMLGYGPAVLIIVAFLLMAILVPTVSPAKQEVTSAGSSANNQPLAANGLPVSGGIAGSGTGSTATSVPAGSTGTGSSTSGSGSSTGGGASSNPGAPPVIKATGTKQVPGDPYSPPGISFSGYNGGATSHGVTAKNIVVTFRIPADNIASVDQAIQQISGKYNSAAFSDSLADIKRTISDLVTYFNEHFQFYGRKIDLKFFQGTGQLTTEIQDAGQSEADADALTAAKTEGAFADISALSQPYAEALSAQGVVNIGAPYMSEQWFEQRAPYAYSFFPDCTDLGDEASQLYVKQVLNQKVTWAGTGVTDGQTRRIGVIVPDNPVYQQCAAPVVKAMDADGHPPVANMSYTLDLSQLSQEAASMEQQIVNDKVTTVACACDPITLIYLTGDLDNAHYEPEIINIGAAFTDEDLLAQLFDQNAWAHAAGITNNGTVPAYGSSLGYFAAKSVDPNNPPAHEVDIIYEDLYILALGIQLAGPDLTPTNFEKGLQSYQGGDGEYGPWTFNVNGVGYFTPQHEFRYEWWDPNGTSAYDNEKGTWVTGSTWYTASDVPSSPMPVFPNGPQ